MSKIEVIRATVDAYVSVILKFGYTVDLSDGKSKTRGNQWVTFTVNDNEYNRKMWTLPEFFKQIAYDLVHEYVGIADKNLKGNNNT